MKIKKIIRYFIMVLATVAFIVKSSLNADAQSVGVVLNGGGAKGLYHIGILKALEENEIPIDYVAGTSMGAIVSAMYATGMSPEEMIIIFESGDVEKWLSGKIEAKYQYYYKKAEENGTMFSLDVNLKEFLKKNKTQKQSKDEMLENIDNEREVKIKDNSKFKSAIPATQLDMAMLDYFAPASAAANNNFDNLFVPFRCVSANILKREEHLWKEGNLGIAVRSSMAIPLIFEPIVTDGMLMVDGGVLNNFPWKEMKEEFNPDIIIGGICTGGTSLDPTTISGQIGLLTSSQTDYNMPDTLGIKIARDVKVGLLDYSKARYAITKGYEDAITLMPEIKKRIERRADRDSLIEKREEFKISSPTLLIDSIIINGLTADQTNYVKKQIRIKNGKPLTFEEFKSEYFKVLEGGMMSGSFPISSYNPESGNYTITVEMSVRPSLKTMLGINISSSNINEGYIGFEYGKVGKINSTQTISGYLGNFYSTANYNGRYNFYTKKRPLYLTNGVTYTFQDYGRGNNQRYSYDNRSYDYSRLNGINMNAAVGWGFTRTSKLELRGAVGQDTYKYDTPDAYIVEVEPNRDIYDFVSSTLSLSRNTLNFKAYPTSGLKQSLSVFLTLGKNDFTEAKITSSSPEISIIKRDLWYGASFRREHYVKTGNVFSIGYLLEGIYTTLPDLGNYATELIAPGFSPTEHSKTLFIPEYHNASYAAAGLMPILKWNDNLYLKGEVYGYMPDITYLQHIKDKIRIIGSASLVYQSPVGPVSINYSHYQNDYISENYFTLNVGFILFNERGIKYF